MAGIGSTWLFEESGASPVLPDPIVTGSQTNSYATASTAAAFDGSKRLVSVTNTGSGNNVLATAPTLTAVTLLATTVLPSGVTLSVISGSPEGALSAVVGSQAMRSDGGAGTSLYLKETGSGNTGWRAIGPIRGTFTVTLGGCDSFPTGTAKYCINGTAVTLYLPALSGTSDANTLTYSGLPASLYPTDIQYFTVPSVLDNGVFATAKTDVSVTSSSTITFQLGDSATGFTATGGKGIGHQFAITYLL
jgi:hypothetical protein